MRPTIYKNYLLFILTAIALFSTLDRVALWLLLDDIKADLHLSDTELGVMGGFAFALFYAVMGVPIGRWSDRGNRVVITSLTVLLWSVSVALCGVTRSFVQLLLVRVGVAVGQAGCIPPAFSLMADHFTRAERPWAAAIYQIGAALSFAVGFVLAGWLNELYGWRVTFILLALPGLILAALAWLTLREPRRTKSTHKTASLTRSTVVAPSASHPTLLKVCVTLWANVTFRNVLLCNVVQALFIWGIFQWQPTFFVRSYGLTTGDAGIWLAVTYGLGGLLGTYLAGEWTRRYAANNESLQLRGMAIATAASGVLTIFTFLSPNQYWAFAWAGLNILFQYAAMPVSNSTIQTLVPERMRATAIALLYLLCILIGMGLGPVVVGALSDVWRPSMGEESLRYALLLMAPGFFWGAWYAWRASKTAACDLAVAQLDLVTAIEQRPEVSALTQYQLLELSAVDKASATSAYRHSTNRSERMPDAVD